MRNGLWVYWIRRTLDTKIWSRDLAMMLGLLDLWNKVVCATTIFSPLGNDNCRSTVDDGFATLDLAPAPILRAGASNALPRPEVPNYGRFDGESLCLPIPQPPRIVMARAFGCPWDQLGGLGHGSGGTSELAPRSGGRSRGCRGGCFDGVRDQRSQLPLDIPLTISVDHQNPHGSLGMPTEIQHLFEAHSQHLGAFTGSGDGGVAKAVGPGVQANGLPQGVDQAVQAGAQEAFALA